MAPPHASGHCLVPSLIYLLALEVLTTTGIEQVHLAKISSSLHSFSLLSSGPESFLLDNMVAHSSEVLALGDRLHSLSGLSKNGTPIVLNKQMLRYYQRAKKERRNRVKDSLLLEAVESLSAPLVQYQSKPVAGFTAQTVSEAITGQAFVLSSSTRAGQVSVEEESAQVKHAPKNTNPMWGFY